MRILVLLTALAMPIVAYFSQRGTFGPDNGAISNQYPTLLVAAGYAFAIWSLIFTLDLVLGVWQMLTTKRQDTSLDRIRPAVALGFGLTASWMIVFSQRWFWLALAIIWLSLGAMLYASIAAARSPVASQAYDWKVRWSLGVHAGWLSLAAFLNTAQVIVAEQLLPTDAMLSWSAGLWALAGMLLLAINHALRGHPAYLLAALWGLAGVMVKQSASSLAGSDASAWIAGVLALGLVLQTAWLWSRRQRLATRSPHSSAASA